MKKKYYAMLHILKILYENKHFYFKKYSSSIQKIKKKLLMNQQIFFIN